MKKYIFIGVLIGFIMGAALSIPIRIEKNETVFYPVIQSMKYPETREDAAALCVKMMSSGFDMCLIKETADGTYIVSGGAPKKYVYNSPLWWVIKKKIEKVCEG